MFPLVSLHVKTKREKEKETINRQTSTDQVPKYKYSII